ncbi:hypothetical protein DFH07DRAFT_1012711 [Mycena maculata]|uniref:Mid2 domain-containing protein n=1 Tax=Mycena maculata TaxID=230809 RepID=A0AAD7HC51_9AGAR|nr:hypothetical protein DFH07DRAFT_1012711 [Mycena maculata]
MRNRLLSLFLLWFSHLGVSAPPINQTIGATGSSIQYAGSFNENCDSQSECVTRTSSRIQISFEDDSATPTSMPGFAIYVSLAPNGPCILRIDGNDVKVVGRGNTDFDNLIFVDTELSNESHVLVIIPEDEVEFQQIIVTSGDIPALPPVSPQTSGNQTPAPSSSRSSSIRQNASSSIFISTSFSFSGRPSTNGTSAAPIPGSSSTTQASSAASSESKRAAGEIIGGVVGGVLLVSAILSAVLLRWWRSRGAIPKVSPFETQRRQTDYGDGVPTDRSGSKGYRDLAVQLRAIEARFARLERMTPRAGSEDAGIGTSSSPGAPPTYE